MGATDNLEFECRCGAVSGELRNVGPSKGDRYTCYCKDCRGLARYLEREDTLDEAGGASVYQTRVGNLSIERGLDHLASVNLAGKQTLRWFCKDCRTPLFNTMDNGRWPFLSMITASIDPNERNRVLGPPRGSVFAQFATGPNVVTPPVSAFTMIRRVVVRLFADKLSGARKRYPLFDAETSAPIAVPRKLTPEEYRDITR
ncbi:DUF6151 family protein [Qipengyuania gelatinilytica]|uniref:CENP-V/GFA domain-containing protein n=1 Tax=Qipengyuania gelatinilytica TaxID=2867231 RepID=A0ABX9A1P8_9SPHN|nr:DUF6151 family protein [Qipengyuania gelatinilytica]QZD95168.1 hypothetical protein K3136_00070 [Qipengyuania gelatinilytica]